MPVLCRNTGWAAEVIALMSSGGERPSESIAVNFTKIVQKYTQFKAGGEQVQADPKGWDLATGKQFNG